MFHLEVERSSEAHNCHTTVTAIDLVMYDVTGELEEEERRKKGERMRQRKYESHVKYCRSNKMVSWSEVKKLQVQTVVTQRAVSRFFISLFYYFLLFCFSLIRVIHCTPG